ncbi:DinB family protein [Flavihumibacter sp. ZG627]|uniref:DinB family protein n=1 Tax=Flavihumibacter sp. ZG627 TaxID=1463156 RepID=UPI00057CB53A|nr:DinB family protein [Flavihumibacter sp. ZG627]KIC92587.1 hypothetical protein HY58_03405 [Flavihumibacter sp. ZG627]
MKEVQRLKLRMQEMYDGEPWLDVSLLPVLRQVPACLAAKKLRPDRNSIWEIVNHLAAWKEAVLRRLTVGKETSPEHNFFLPVENKSDASWEASLKALEQAHKKWMMFLEGMEDKDLDKIYYGNRSWHYHIEGLIQHDAYHLGQIVLLTKLIPADNQI